MSDDLVLGSIRPKRLTDKDCIRITTKYMTTHPSPLDLAKEENLEVSTVLKAVGYIFKQFLGALDVDFERKKLIEHNKMMQASLHQRLQESYKLIELLDESLFAIKEQHGKLSDAPADIQAQWSKLLSNRQYEIQSQVNVCREIRHHNIMLTEMLGIRKGKPQASKAKAFDTASLVDHLASLSEDEVDAYIESGS